MFISDLFIIFQWWITFFIIGIIFLPLSFSVFSEFFDKGYIFSRIIGISIISYVAFILGLYHILSFSRLNLIIVLSLFFLISLILFKKLTLKIQRKHIFIFIFEEIIFFISLTFWSFIKTHQPDIHGLEKFMDYGFINSILRSDYFPPKDMWFTPFYINYYYFGHLITAVLTKISDLPSSASFNLMLSTIFAFTLVCSFSIGANLIFFLLKSSKKYSSTQKAIKIIVGGLLTSLLITFAGNLHAVYTFFKPYQNDNPVPFWKLVFSPSTFPNSYWYPNATRFIYNTIHEFPIYSFVVSDLHGHVLDIPFVLLTIAILLSLFLKLNTEDSFKIKNIKLKILLISFLLAVMYMTNAWDGLIYFILSVIVIFFLSFKDCSKNISLKIQSYNLRFKFFNLEFEFYTLRFTFYVLAIGIGFFIFLIPFNSFFEPFVSGIGVLCAPSFLTKIGKIGPFLFEPEHCQKSPIWQLFILYGFFYFWVISFLIFLRKRAMILTDKFILIIILLSTLLILIPEFLYIKDIYPAHYRANTMFKLVYQSFILLSISSGYIVFRIITNLKSLMKLNAKGFSAFVFILISVSFIVLILIYPYYAVSSYFGDLKTYYGLDGTTYLKKTYPSDYKAINWINKNIKGQPVVLEAQGDSYTDFARVSSNTGLPTVLGWTVHEWLWRKTYDVPAPRISDVQTLYETKDIQLTKNLINKYHVSLVFVGDLEKQKYTNLNEQKFNNLGKIIFKEGETRIYKINLYSTNSGLR